MYDHPSIGGHWCKRLTMGVRNSLEMFQDKMNEMVYGFGFIRSYIYGLLIINMGDWYNNMENLELILQKLKDNKHKCNITSHYLEKPDMEYLGV